MYKKIFIFDITFYDHNAEDDKISLSGDRPKSQGHRILGKLLELISVLHVQKTRRPQI